MIMASETDAINQVERMMNSGDFHPSVQQLVTASVYLDEDTNIRSLFDPIVGVMDIGRTRTHEIAAVFGLEDEEIVSQTDLIYGHLPHSSVLSIEVR